MAQRNVILQMHTTLDGFADSKNGFVPIEDRPYWKELERAFALTGASEVDTLLMGKGTYKQFAGFWPNVATDPKAPKDWKAQARSLHETPKVVFSKTLPKADWNNSTIVRGDVGREIARLKRLPGKNMLVPGGVDFPRTLIERDLVDEYLLSVVPTIVGQTRNRLFGHLARQRSLHHVRSWTFRNGVTLHQLRRAK
ncbi:MAG: dihydrofolate reductase family protein [Thermoplasmata archaeon]